MDHSAQPVRRNARRTVRTYTSGRAEPRAVRYDRLLKSGRGLTRRSAAVRLLGLWVRIPPWAWISLVSVVCCQVEVSATGRSPVGSSPTECGLSECDSEASTMRPRPTKSWDEVTCSLLTSVRVFYYQRSFLNLWPPRLCFSAGNLDVFKQNNGIGICFAEVFCFC